MLQTILLVLGLLAVLVSMVSLVEGVSVPGLVSDLRAKTLRARRVRRNRRDHAVYPYFYDIGLQSRVDGQPCGHHFAVTEGRISVGSYKLNTTPMPEGMCPVYTLRRHGAGHRVSCSGEEARLWRDAAIGYVAALREAGTTLRAAHERTRLRFVRLLPGGRRRIAAELQEARGRFREQALTAAATYRPVHDEIERRIGRQCLEHARRGG
ncbi:hypothetical protein [Streptosporangium sp. NPDC051022]|uniref:hypothetical protein n=1 Tax=Streptosporangium sp. NPDC051022 TaxID=3155752 RepID=UPI00343FC01D